MVYGSSQARSQMGAISSNPPEYTKAGSDRWEPHYMYIGEIVEAIEK